MLGVLRGRRDPARLAVVALFLASLVGCRSVQSAGRGESLSIDISAPVVVGVPSRIVVTLADAAGAPLVGAQVEVEGNMRHAGMTPVSAKAAEVEAGRYVVSDFEFTMAGDWVVTARATLPDGGRVEKSVEVPGVASAVPSAAAPSR